jgi:hypothetical protein
MEMRDVLHPSVYRLGWLLSLFRESLMLLGRLTELDLPNLKTVLTSSSSFSTTVHLEDFEAEKPNIVYVRAKFC